MRVLLTGATGFVGRVAAETLAAGGHDVVGVSRTAATPVHSKRTIRATLGSDDFVERVLAEAEPCEAIVHAAACISHDNSNPELISVNCLGTQQIATLAEKWTTPAVVYLSSLPLIGVPLTHPITEAHPTSPRTTYHATKLFGEHVLAAAARDRTCVSLRLTAPVGPGMPDNRALSTFVRAALAGSPITLVGKGGRIQNYVDVRDIAAAIVSCIEQKPRGVFNLGGPAAISNLELAETCIRVLNSKSTIVFSSTPDTAEGEVWDVSSDAAKRAFGYTPKHDVVSSIHAVARQYERGLD